MSFVRTAVATAVAALSIVAATQDAHAFQPIQGAKKFGPSYSKSTGDSDFNASLQIEAQAYANDYDQICATTKPSYQCSGKTGFGYSMCKMIFTAVSNQTCQKHGVGFGAKGGASTDVTLFGKSLDLFDIGASASAEPALMSAEYHVNVLGAKIAGQSKSTAFKAGWSVERTLATASSTVMLGPVPVTVEASAVGKLGIDFDLTLGTAQVQGGATPYAGVDGVFSAGIGVKGFSGGVEGELLLVQISTPATATVAFQGGKSFAWNADLDLVIQALDGSVSLYGEAGPFRGTVEIFSWEGLSYTKNLASQSGTFSL
jgi:hypothetical protein